MITEQRDGLTQTERIRAQVLDTLAELGKLTVGDDMITFEGKKFVLPEQFATDIPGAIRYLMEIKEQNDAAFNYSRDFEYRPVDGAAAFDRAMKRVFGTTGTGRTLHTFFGPILPEFRTVKVGADGTTIQVPWGQVHLEPLEATFTIYQKKTKDRGPISHISVEAPRKYRQHIEAFFAVIAEELRSNSIYRGKAFTGGEEPEFLDTRALDPSKVVYSEEVLEQLDTELWSVLRFSDVMRQHGQTLKRAVLLEGPYGTGKSLAGKLTAAVAVAHGWTFIIARPGKDDLGEVLNTAKLYAPAVVWFEDVDVVAEGEDPQDISRLLDVLDGITNKGTDVVAAFTTNHVDKIHKGVLRPGRVDAIVHIGALDASGVEKLIRANVPAEFLDDDVDFGTVAEAHEGYLPAFVAESAGRAFRRSAARNSGTPGVITTEDLVYAAGSLRAQHELMTNAEEGKATSDIETALRSLLRGGVTDLQILDEENDLVGVIAEASKN